MITTLLIAMAALQPSAWTWTLYEGDGPVVLAEEIPDTPRLRNTLECEPGSGVARVTLYRQDARGGFVTLVAQDATTQSEAETVSGGATPGVMAPVRLDHPVFAAFRARGSITMRGAGGSWTLDMPLAELPKLRRFAELCAG